VAAACIVLNGPSCSGKSSIAAALQQRWPRPLQSTGIDTFLASQSDRFFAIDGTLTDGISWVPTTVDGMPAFDIVPGELGLGMIRASHSFWSSCVEEGLDQVIDDVWVIHEQPTGLERALSRATVLWVGVHCPLPIIVQREQDRGDRPVGAARGH
jgi:chloramphenicol 3-O phosphotransferase